MEDFKKDIDSNTIIVGDFNTPLSKMGTFSKQNINKHCGIEECPRSNGLNGYIYIGFHPKETKYTFFSKVHGIFSKIDHKRGQKTNLNKSSKLK